ncbi:MAG: DUF72 domain-containing protein [Candidatus Hadarchaeales archaeon]
MKILVGCCGWAVGKSEYFKTFKTVEIQSTFYRLPKVETAEKWRREAPEGFVFCMKAWQAITHLPTSPTWRRSGFSAEELEEKEYGWLRPTKDNFEAWEKTLEISKELGARICVIQCPPNFRATEENEKNMRRFLSKIERGGTILGWEPRGDWAEHPEKVKELCEELDLVHVVDPLRNLPLHLGSKKVAYFRLHGFGKPSIYNYRYSQEELRRAAEISVESRAREVYCMFNNLYMAEDASRLMKILKKRAG